MKFRYYYFEIRRYFHFVFLDHQPILNHIQQEIS